MDQDLAVQISRVRNILRRALQLGRSSQEALSALARLKELAQRGDDGALEFEHLRWSFHLASLPGAREAA
jgi:hypothetical protein